MALEIGFGLRWLWGQLQKRYTIAYSAGFGTRLTSGEWGTADAANDATAQLK